MAMKSGWPKGSASVATAAFPRSLAYIAVSVAGLALFLFLASLLLVSSPISSTVQGYFYKVDTLEVIQRNQNDTVSNVGLDTNNPSRLESNVEVVPVADKERKEESEKEDTGLSVKDPVISKEQKEESVKKDSGLEIQAPVTYKEREVDSEKEDAGSNVEDPVINKEQKEESVKKDSGLEIPVPVTDKEREVESSENKDSGLNLQALVTDKEREVESEKKDAGLEIQTPVSDKEQEVDFEKKDSGSEIQAPVTDREPEVDSENKDSGSEIQAPVADKEPEVESEKKDSGLKIQASVADKERELESNKKDSGLEIQAPVTDNEEEVESEKKDSGLEIQAEAPVTDKGREVESEKKASGSNLQVPVTDKESEVESDKKDSGLEIQAPVSDKEEVESGKKDFGLEIQAPVTNKEREVESEKKDIQPVTNKGRKEEPGKKDPELNLQAPITDKERIVESEKRDPELNLQVPITNRGRKEDPGKKDGPVPIATNDVGRKSFPSVDNGVKDEGTSSVPSASQKATTRSDDLGCDLFKGNWFYDPIGPSYTNNSCPVITQMQNCQGNGRPDREYESWRWKPSQCDLPRFDAKKFLELMRGKTIAFIGDSVARNHMESLMCLLWQVEVPKNRGNRRMHRYYFRSTSTMIVRMWSSWLVHQTPEAIDFAPEGVTKVHLDAPDENFMQFVPTFDVVVLSSGHWFAKQSVYVLNKEIVGGQLWWPDKSRVPKISNIEAFAISVETIVASMLTHPNYTGLTILRSYSPDHYEGGAWNTGGSCTGKTRPLEPEQLVRNDYVNIMHEKQVTGYQKGVKKAANKSKIKLMDVTEVFSYRHDGHPGPYRSSDPNKRTQYGPDGRPPPQDCLHWCMPGPIDTWNELVLEIIKREFEVKKST